MAFLKFIGRLLIVLALISSSYLHITSPAKSTQEFSQNYKLLDDLSAQYLQYDIPFDNVNWQIGVKVFGLFEAVVIFFIIIGDGLGGFFYVASVVGELFFLLWPKFAAGKIQQWNFNELSEVAHFGTLIGIGLVLLCSGCSKTNKC